ncbi:Hpt domain-containing protein [Sulfurimonas sp.]|uniref:Hpt domain-containing protein n=1 Tax=Sulfurimonas sp. TaxID=2022749 RepID=UPI002AB1DC26|nr:Hpt domain-containing protein [Sulfurimonas sp.]
MNRKQLFFSQASDVGSDYLYDPHLASEELGLPVDLIEEFIQDFINQAEEFKISLYDSLNSDDIDKVKILSHKLKGVAANLRIEDAFEVLTTINTSDNTDKIKTNIDTFYLIVEKLSGKTFKQAKPSPVQEEEEEEVDDDLILSFKDEDEKIQEQQEIEIDIPNISKLAKAPIKDVIEKIEIEEVKLDLDLDLELDEFDNNLEISQELAEPSYSKTLAANEIGIDIEDFKVLFDDYIQEGNKTCDNVQEAIEQNDLQKCKKIAKKLKSISENMRIDALSKNLESIIGSQNIEAVKESISKVRTTLEKLSQSEA